MQPLDPQSQSPDPSLQPPQVPQSPQPPLSAPQTSQAPFGGPQQQLPYGGAPGQIPGAEKKLPAGICGILLGAFGVHKFILGYTNTGITMLAISLVGGLLSFGLISGVVGIIGLIEGIIYLTKSDQQFVQEYVYNKKPWF